jgi:hypothetical protein
MQYFVSMFGSEKSEEHGRGEEEEAEFGARQTKGVW